MSNWSVVILSWPSIDMLGEQSEETPEDHRRLREVNGAYLELSDRGGGWVVIPSCPDDKAPGSACEFVAVTHINHFGPEDLLFALGSFAWEYPEEVHILWKSEDMVTYEIESLD